MIGDFYLATRIATLHLRIGGTLAIPEPCHLARSLRDQLGADRRSTIYCRCLSERAKQSTLRNDACPICSRRGACMSPRNRYYSVVPHLYFCGIKTRAVGKLRICAEWLISKSVIGLAYSRPTSASRQLPTR